MADTKALTIAELIQVCKDCKERLPREECMIHVDDIARTLKDVQDTIDKDSAHLQQALIEAEQDRDELMETVENLLDFRFMQTKRGETLDTKLLLPHGTTDLVPWSWKSRYDEALKVIAKTNGNPSTSTRKRCAILAAETKED